jgi:hypothetical protein
MDQIAKAVMQMEQLTRKTAANAEESASASEELGSQAAMMREQVQSLQEVVGAAGVKRGMARIRGDRRPGPRQTRVHEPDRDRRLSADLGALKSAVGCSTMPDLTRFPPAGGRDRSALPLDDNDNDFHEF